MLFWDKWGVSGLCSLFRQIVESNVRLVWLSGAKGTFSEDLKNVSFDVHNVVRGVKVRQEGLKNFGLCDRDVLMGPLDKRGTTWM